jgi:hypothetical protein
MAKVRSVVTLTDVQTKRPLAVRTFEATTWKDLVFAVAYWLKIEVAPYWAKGDLALHWTAGDALLPDVQLSAGLYGVACAYGMLDAGTMQRLEATYASGLEALAPTGG